MFWTALWIQLWIQIHYTGINIHKVSVYGSILILILIQITTCCNICCTWIMIDNLCCISGENCRCQGQKPAESGPGWWCRRRGAGPHSRSRWQHSYPGRWFTGSAACRCCSCRCCSCSWPVIAGAAGRPRDYRSHRLALPCQVMVSVMWIRMCHSMVSDPRSALGSVIIRYKRLPFCDAWYGNLL